VKTVSCASASLIGITSSTCTVTLTGAAPVGGLAVGLSSSSLSLTLPVSVTVSANATTATFTVVTLAVTGSQTVTLTATVGSVSATFTLQLGPSVPTLSINASSIAFGNVGLNTPSTQTVTFTSSGTGAVTINSATLTGTGFSMSGVTFPVTLNPGSSTTLNLVFDPTTAGAATGSLTIVSTSSTGGTSAISLSGTGISASYQVELSWDPPSGSGNILGYNILRTTSGGTTYQQLNTTIDSNTTYIDTTVRPTVSYQYVVETVSGAGVVSAPSSPFTVKVP